MRTRGGTHAGPHAGPHTGTHTGTHTGPDVEPGVVSRAARALCVPQLLAISRLEQKIVEELTSAADWTTAEPWSEQSQVLRDRLNKLCAQIRMHMATQESLLPDMLREHWGHVSPPQLMLRSLQAAKRAQAQGAKSLEKPKLLMWVLHYLERRAPHRARYVRAALPMLKRLRLALGRDASHAKVLGHLRCIILDEAPRTSVAVLAQSGGETSTRESQRMDEDSGAGGGGTELEKQRKAGMVNAVLAAANARRVDVPFNSNETTRVLASSEAPLHTFKMDGKWADKADKVPDNLCARARPPYARPASSTLTPLARQRSPRAPASRVS